MRILTLVTFSLIFVTISGFLCFRKHRAKVMIGGGANQQYGNSGAAGYTSMSGYGDQKFPGPGGYYQSGNNNNQLAQGGFGQSSSGLGEMNNNNRNMPNQRGYGGQPGLSGSESQFNQRSSGQTGPSQYPGPSNANQFAGPAQGNTNQFGQNSPNGFGRRGPNQNRPVYKGSDEFNQGVISNSEQNEIASRGGSNRGFEPDKNLRQLPRNQNFGTDTQTPAQQRSTENSIGGGSIENGSNDNQRSMAMNSGTDLQTSDQQRRISGNVEGRFENDGLTRSQTNIVEIKKSSSNEKELERVESDQRDRKDDTYPDEVKRVKEDRKMSSESSRRSGSSPDLGGQIGKMLFKYLLNPGR